MKINEYKNIETSLDDVESAIRDAGTDRCFLDQQIERLQWAISEINKLSLPTTCPDENQLIHNKSTYVNALKRLKAAKRA